MLIILISYLPPIGRHHLNLVYIIFKYLDQKRRNPDEVCRTCAAEYCHCKRFCEDKYRKDSMNAVNAAAAKIEKTPLRIFSLSFSAARNLVIAKPNWSRASGMSSDIVTMI